ncbi:MAG: chloramphenicol acetyltransferase [Candidatus Neomarinimicrobiota bacterium]
MKTLDISRWARRQHFVPKLRDRNLDYPHYCLTANADISRLIQATKEKRLSVFQMILYVVMRTTNEIQEFRYRIRGEAVVEHEIVHPSFTVMAGAEVFSFCSADYDPDARRFFQNVEAATLSVKNAPVIADEPGCDDRIYVTSIPWISFTGVSHPIHMHPTDSVPRIAWGKFFPNGEQIALPLSVQVHHALVDGIHVAQFYQKFEENCRRCSEYF